MSSNYEHFEITDYYFYGFEIISERRVPQKSQGEKIWVGQKATISLPLAKCFHKYLSIFFSADFWKFKVSTWTVFTFYFDFFYKKYLEERK